MTTSTELRIPTQTFLLPGQEFCIGLPWERDALPKHGVIANAKSPFAKLTLRGDVSDRADALEGFELGACTVLRRLSEGGARTLLAMRREPGLAPALVVLRRLELPDALAREVRTHAEWAGHYAHPGLVTVFPCEVSDEGVFWVSELASGATLTELSAAMKKTGQSVPLGLALGSVIDIARALGELHSHGAAHGLVSDQSIAVGFDGAARLHDTGLFRCMAQGASWLELREAMATFFAPEQLLEGRLPDPKTDVFSLAAVLYESLTGERVRRAKTFDQHFKLAQEGTFVPASRLNFTVNPALDAVLNRALSPRRSERYANGREFALALTEAASAFSWKKELRAQFVARHFAQRKAEDESLRRQLESTPVLPDAREHDEREDAPFAPLTPAPVVALKPVARSVSPVVVKSFPAAPAPGRVSKKRAAAAASATKRASWAAARIAFALAMGLGVLVARVSAPKPVPAPLPTLIWLDDAATESVNVEVVLPLASREEVSRDAEPLAAGIGLADPAPPPHVQRATTRRVRARDEAPLPPWLAKKSTRRR